MNLAFGPDSLASRLELLVEISNHSKGLTTYVREPARKFHAQKIRKMKIENNVKKS